jgi:hypothetical protein
LKKIDGGILDGIERLMWGGVAGVVVFIVVAFIWDMWTHYDEQRTREKEREENNYD